MSAQLIVVIYAFRENIFVVKFKRGWIPPNGVSGRLGVELKKNCRNSTTKSVSSTMRRKSNTKGLWSPSISHLPTSSSSRLAWWWLMLQFGAWSRMKHSALTSSFFKSDFCVPKIQVDPISRIVFKTYDLSCIEVLKKSHWICFSFNWNRNFVVIALNFLEHKKEIQRF